MRHPLALIESCSGGGATGIIRLWIKDKAAVLIYLLVGAISRTRISGHLQWILIVGVPRADICDLLSISACAEWMFALWLVRFITKADQIEIKRAHYQLFWQKHLEPLR